MILFTSLQSLDSIKFYNLKVIKLTPNIHVALQLHGILVHLSAFVASLTLAKHCLEVLDYKASLDNLYFKQWTNTVSYLTCMQ